MVELDDIKLYGAILLIVVFSNANARRVCVDGFNGMTDTCDAGNIARHPRLCSTIAIIMAIIKSPRTVINTEISSPNLMLFHLGSTANCFISSSEYSLFVVL